MLSSISPLGERARHNRWAVTVAWYVAASATAGAVIGGVLAFVGGLVDPAQTVRAAVLAGVAAIAAAFDLAGRRVPGPRRQVNEDWLGHYRGWVYGAAFGAQLGAGITTIVTSATVWLVLACELLCGSPVAGVAVGATFGLVRALPLPASIRVTTHARLLGAQRRLAARATMARRVTAAATVGAALGWAAIAI